MLGRAKSMSGELEPDMFEFACVVASDLSVCGSMYHLFNNGCFESSEVTLDHTVC